MKNNYLLECSDGVSLENRISEIIKKSGFENEYKAIYDLEESLLEQALEDLDTYSFLTDKKIVIIKNVFTNANDKNLEHLLKYIENYHPDNLLILTIDKMDNRLNIVKKIKMSKNITIEHIELDPVLYATNLLKEYKISSSSIHLLVDLCKNDITRIDSECHKLMNFAYESREINSKDIEQMVIKKLGDANEVLFSFIRYIILKDKSMAYKSYLELKKHEIDIYSIIGLMSSQIRLTHQVKILAEVNMTNQEIADELHLKSPYQVKKIREYIHHYTYDQIHEVVKKLASIDYDIKSGKIDPSVAIDMLIINI